MSADESEDAALQRLRAHARECGECRATPLPLESIVRALDAGEPVGPVGALRLLTAVAPLLAARRRRAYRKRLARSLLLTLSPLPVIALFDGYMLREAYAVLCGWLPGPLVAWILVGYGAMLLLLTALTYAALPVLLMPPRVEAGGRIS